MEFRIYGNIASSKNSKRWVGKRLINSKTAMSCYKKIIPQLELIKNEFQSAIGELPTKLHIYFYRDSRRKFDYTNVFQLFADALVKCGLIEDDSADYLIPIFEGYEVTDRERAGCRFWLD